MSLVAFTWQSAAATPGDQSTSKSAAQPDAGTNSDTPCMIYVDPQYDRDGRQISSPVWYFNCALTISRKMKYWAAGATPGEEVLMETQCTLPGDTSYVGYTDPSNGTNEPGEFLRIAAFNYYACEYTPPPPPERVTITGRVMVPRNTGTTVERPLSNTKFTLKYRDQEDGVFKPVMTGPGDAGVPVTGTTNEDGDYSVSAYYPNVYELPDRTIWWGCKPALDGSRFGQGHSCEDMDLALIFHGQTADEKITVLNDGVVDEPKLADLGTLYLGKFDRIPSEERTFAHDTALPAYVGAMNVGDLDDRMQPLEMTLVAGGTTFSYSTSGKISMPAHDAPNALPEFAAAVRLHQSLMGAAHPGINDCDLAKMRIRTSESCAYRIGVPLYLAAMAENEPGRQDIDSGLYRAIGGAIHLEECRTAAAIVKPCESGPAVAGNVASALWDYTDRTPGEVSTPKGFPEHAQRPLSSLLWSMHTASPRNFHEFQEVRNLAPDDSTFLEIQAAFANGQLASGTFSEETTVRTGTDWTTVVCDQCYEGVTRQYKPTAGTAAPTATWDISSAVWKDGLYDVYVRLNDLPTADDPAAKYIITTAEGEKVYTLNQNVDGWFRVNLQPVPLDAGAVNKVQLQASTLAPPTSLILDGLIVVPRSPLP